MAAAPPAARSTKPIAIVSTSRITTCLSAREYQTSSPRYASTIQPSAGRTQNAIAMAAAAMTAAAPSAVAVRKLAGGNWPVLLDRVQPVDLAIADVVDQINDARDGAKNQKGRQ